MAVELIHYFGATFGVEDRYPFDFELCRSRDGWAQLDTTSDASYHGAWANPVKRRLVSYIEGDVTVIKCDTAEEFEAELRKFIKFYQENENGWKGADPGLDRRNVEVWHELGLADLLHESYREDRWAPAPTSLS